MRILASCCIFVLLLGCEIVGPDGAAQRDGPLQIQTDQATYTPGDLATLTITNVGSTTLYYNTCMPRTLQTIEDGAAVDVKTYPVCRCLCITSLAPGEAWSLTATMSRPEITNAMPGDQRFRLRLDFYEDADLRRPLPEAFVVTNSFTIAL